MVAQTNLHELQPVLTTGALPDQAKAAVILLHGRGASARDILGLAQEFDHQQVVYFAPQAANATWYPQRFIAPRVQNEPWLTWALARVEALLQQTQAAGIPADKTVLMGFSQGASLALETAARHPRRYGGVVGFSGGLIGEEGIPLRYDSDANLAGTPIFLGCSDVDFHIPKARVEESAAVLQSMQAEVTMKLYPGMGHTINDDELNFARQMIDGLVRG